MYMTSSGSSSVCSDSEVYCFPCSSHLNIEAFSGGTEYFVNFSILVVRARLTGAQPARIIGRVTDREKFERIRNGLDRTREVIDRLLDVPASCREAREGLEGKEAVCRRTIHFDKLQPKGSQCSRKFRPFWMKNMKDGDKCDR